MIHVNVTFPWWYILIGVGFYFAGVFFNAVMDERRYLNRREREKDR